MLMGSERSFIIAVILCFSLLLQTIQGMDHSHDRNSLDDFMQDYARSSLSRSHTGTLYNISLPGNYSGMEVSLIRLRTASFWQRGGNYSFFHFPPRILPTPSVKRLDIVLTNVGNWSSLYFDVPNYSFVTPVIGFMTYGARNSSEKGTLPLGLDLLGDPILVRFPSINLPGHDHKSVEMKCAIFWANGTVELTNMTLLNACVAHDQGHFSIVTPMLGPISPSPAPSMTERKRREKLWKWWVIGFGVGVVGLLLISLVVFTMIKLIRTRRIRKMERQSEKNVALDTTWVGTSRMPSASGIRTQPALENDYFP